MQTSNGKMAAFVAGGAVVGGLPLLAFIVLFLQLMEARNAGHPLSGDGLGLAMMSLSAYGLALLSISVGIVYFGYKSTRHQRRPKQWHLMALAWTAAEVVAPILYFAFF